MRCVCVPGESSSLGVHGPRPTVRGAGKEREAQGGARWEAPQGRGCAVMTHKLAWEAFAGPRGRSVGPPMPMHRPAQGPAGEDTAQGARFLPSIATCQVSGPLHATTAAFRAPGCGLAHPPTRSAHELLRHLLPCLACPIASMGFHPSSPSHPLPRSLLGTHSDPSVPAPGIFAPCCPHAQTAPRSLHPPWRRHGSWRRTFAADGTGPGRLGWMRAGWNGPTHTGWS